MVLSHSDQRNRANSRPRAAPDLEKRMATIAQAKVKASWQPPAPLGMGSFRENRWKKHWGKHRKNLDYL